ncbi:unnamed protein product [Rotaria sordida]|uniref:Dynamin GTPase domain-containing protein n=1 Tax=Rotaria sordida TaxID=392033 RepID=A0A814KUY0_9BILA|nr:unnamed protein product [Rotaria sordida]
MLAEELNNKESRELLSAVDRMREILQEDKICLPEIVVVGDQSVGKSSVLEAVSGIQLPRAQNICTRCPLELRMKVTTGDEYAIIHSNKTSENTKKTIDNMKDIAAEVIRLTNDIAGNGTNVSSHPIYLTVYKRNIPYDLTLIDLPGITRNPLPGQAEDIHSQILTLINKYIEPSTAVVLHVIPSSVDFTTSESMKLAKEFDPNCERQLIAVSKIDKYDKGIAQKLLGEGLGSMKLQLGCIAVLNRNQDEIDSNISFEEMKEREKQFFIKHNEAFQNLPDEYKGIDQLIKKLAIIQHSRIRSTFPETIEQLRKQIRSKKFELKNIPMAMTTEHECWTKFQSMIDTFRESIQAKVNGDYDCQIRNSMFNVNKDTSENINNTTTISSSQLKIAFISMPGDDHIAYHLYKFQQKFQEILCNSFSNFSSDDYKKLTMIKIDYATGVSLPNFQSFKIIESSFREELSRLPKICFSLVKDIHDYLNKILLKIYYQTFDQEYPRLIQRLKEVIIEKIDEAEDRTIERVQEILDMEKRLFTLNSEYMNHIFEMRKTIDTGDRENYEQVIIPSSTQSSSVKGRNGIVDSNKIHYISTTFPPMTNQSILSSGSNEVHAATDIQTSLKAYSEIVKKRIIDVISQICYHQFITLCTLEVHKDMTMAIPASDLIRYMKEPYDRTMQRQNLKRSINAYEEALKLGQEHL